MGRDEADERAAMLSLVNPSNPTGDFMPLAQLKQWIEATADDDSFVLIDESMLPWHSADWKSESLLSAGDWIADLYTKRKVAVFVMHRCGRSVQRFAAVCRSL